MGQDLLQLLGLPKPRAAPVAAPPPAKPLPADAPRQVDLLPRDVLERRANGLLSDAELATALKSLPADPVQRIDALADLVPKIGDAARRDPVVRTLRDLLAKVVPFISEDDAKKKLDKAIDSLVEKGVKSLIEALLKAAVGKGPTAVDPDAPPRYGPALEEKDLGEKILKLPEIPLPWDKPKKRAQSYFEFRGLRPNYKPSKYFDVVVRTPDWFEPNGRAGAGWVVLSRKDEFDKSGDGAKRLADKRLEQKGDVKVSLVAPDEPGAYVLYIVVGPSAEHTPVETITVAK